MEKTESQLLSLPGRPVRGSKTGKPLMAALDLFGRRWVLRIVWELRNGPLTSRALSAACGGVSPSILQQRLDELRLAKIIMLELNRGYALTNIGQGLFQALEPLQIWAARWGKYLK